MANAYAERRAVRQAFIIGFLRGPPTDIRGTLKLASALSVSRILQFFTAENICRRKGRQIISANPIHS